LAAPSVALTDPRDGTKPDVPPLTAGRAGGLAAVASFGAVAGGFAEGAVWPELGWPELGATTTLDRTIGIIIAAAITAAAPHQTAGRGRVRSGFGLRSWNCRR
jgi:hypothetical protein